MLTADLSALVAWGYTRPALGANFRQNRKTLPMPFLRCATIFLLISATVVLTGARNPQTKLNATPANPETHSAAVRLLDEALGRLDADRVQWLDTRLWQKGRIGRYDFEAEGRYLTAPDRRFRLEIT